MAWNAEEIIRAIEETTVGSGNLGVVKVGRTNNYVRIYGPSVETKSGAPCLVIERYNGTVAVNVESVAGALRFATRPKDKTIRQDPLGASSGAVGNFGSADWALCSKDAEQRYLTLSDYARTLVGAMKDAPGAW
jgi:hypothetical protein